ncbi:MAG: hypothetical protein AAFQ68_01870 [Bacteroidota bacterium]
MSNINQDYQHQDPQITAHIRGLVDQYQDSLQDERAIKVEIAGLDRERQYKLCSLVKAQKTEQAYRDIHNMVSVNANKEAGLVVDHTQQLADESTALGTTIHDAVKCMKDLREKLKAVHAEACNLKSAVSEEQSCNLKLYEAIKAEVSKADIRDESGKSKMDLDEMVTAIHQYSEDLQALTMTAFSTGVDISGIQTFSYIESLAPYAAQLNADMSAFYTDVNTNLAFADGEVDNAQSGLTAILEQLSQMQFDRFAADSDQMGLRKTIISSFRIGTDDKQCDATEDRRRNLHEICEKVNDIFTAKVNDTEGQEEKESWDLPDDKDMDKKS